MGSVVIVVAVEGVESHGWGLDRLYIYCKPGQVGILCLIAATVPLCTPSEKVDKVLVEVTLSCFCLEFIVSITLCAGKSRDIGVIVLAPLLVP